MAVSIPRVGLQLYTLKDQFASDPFGTIRQVATIGFKGVEFVGNSLMSIDVRKLNVELIGNDLNAAGIAFEIEELEGRLDAILDICHSINCPTVVMPSIRSRDCQNRRGLMDVALKMNAIAGRCKTDGVAFLYHTHGLELKVVEGRSGLEWLSGYWDPQLVHLEVDTYWVEHAGIEAVGFMKQYGSLCSSIHCKDMKDRMGKSEAEIGTGVIDMGGVAREGVVHNVEWFIVEQEEFSGDPMESVKISYRNLSRIINDAVHAIATP